MELAEPSIGTAFDRCVERGAQSVAVAPLFLFKGRHVQEDIPALVKEAAERHPGESFTIAEPIGMHPLVASALDQQLSKALTENTDVAGAGGEA